MNSKRVNRDTILLEIVRELHLMAKKYANRATESDRRRFNQITHQLISMRVPLEASTEGGVWARGKERQDYVDSLSKEQPNPVPLYATEPLRIKRALTSDYQEEQILDALSVLEGEARRMRRR